jgi:hypothetical protein
MTMIADHGRGHVRCLGLAAAAMFALSAIPGERAEALSLLNPGAVPTAKYASDGLTTEIRGGHGGGGFHGGGGGGGFHGGAFRGGGAAFHGGGIRSGGAAFHGGGFRSGGAVIRGGGFRAAHVFHGGHRFAHHRHHFHRRFYYAPSYYYYPPRYCRVVWTYYGPRKICRYRPWYRHHWRHRWHHRWSPYW